MTTILSVTGCIEADLDEATDDADVIAPRPDAEQSDDTDVDPDEESDTETQEHDDVDETEEHDENEPEESDEDEPEEPEDHDEVDDDTGMAEEDLPDTELVVDDDAPQLDIRDIRVEEGRDSHYVSVTCHDPEVDNTRWVSRHRTRLSRRCDVDLATAARAVSIQPDTDLRIAPTPRGFRLIGDFQQGDYDIEIAPGMRTDDGSVLHDEESTTLEVPEMSESVELVAEGRYLPADGWDELTLEHRNVDQVDLNIRHVPRENLSFWIARSGEQADEKTSNLVADTTVAVPEQTDETLTSSIDVHDHLGDPEPGLYEITAASGDDDATSRLQVTDVNLITKRHEADPDAPWEDHIDVWAVDMQTTQPLSGVDVDTIRPSGESMASCKTGRDGHCRLQLVDETTDPTPPTALLAERGENLTYLKFDDLRIDAHIEAADGPDFRADKTYLATMYGDRDLYRPGDDVHVFGALRDTDYTAADPDTPVELTVRDPEGETVVQRRGRTDEPGTFALSFPLSDVAPTGRWTTTLEVGTREIETYSFHVEEFVPERMEVDTEPTDEVFTADREPTFEISAQYLFGASGAGSDVELNCRLVPVDSALDGDDVYYGPLEIDDDREIVDLKSRQDVIGDDDTVEMSCPEPDQTPSGPMRVEATVSVAEGGSGRTTHGSADAMMYPADIQIGLQTDADDLDAGDELTVEGRLVDHDGEIVDDDSTVDLELFNVRRHRSWQYDDSTGRRSLHYDYQLLLERTVDVETTDGRFAVDHTVADVDHAYLVRARHDGAMTELEIDRRGRLWRLGGHDRTPEPRRPSEVTVDAPDQITPGETNRVQFTAPFDGRALMTVETDGVVHRDWTPASEGTNEWSFDVDTDEPNVYVTALIIRDPHESSDDAFMPERAFGSVSADVDHSRIETDVTVDGPDEVRPGETLELELEADGTADGGPAVATVAAVDEGILQLTDYQTPDPVEATWRARSPGVTTFDTIGWATRLPSMNPSSRTGGAAPAQAEASQGRIMPFEPVALWSGPVDIDDDGTATVTFEVPEYSGRLRVMSSVFTGDEMGSTERDVVVRDPLTVQATFPRQMTEDDEADIPVMVTNLTDQTRRLDVDITARPFDVEGFDATPETDDEDVVTFDDDHRTVELDPDASTTLYFTARATRPGGGAEVDVEVTDGDETSGDSGRIPLNPRGPTQRRTHTVSLADGTTDLTEYLDGWVPTSEESNFFVSAVAEPEAFDHLEYLVRYPFGCAEQTISSARPLVQLPNIVQSIDPQFADGGDGLDSKIEHGVSRMLSMQHASGGVGFWPNHRFTNTAYTSLTARTLDFFVQARDEGFDVPDERVESAADWLADRVSGTTDDAFEHFILARAGEPETHEIREAIDELPDDPEGRDLEDSYLLKAALYLAGDRSYEDELRNPDYTTGDGGRSGGRFYSHRRQRALMLAIFVELFGRDDAVEPLAQKVTDAMLEEDRGGLSTQEIVWSLEALAGWYEFEGLDDVDVTLQADGQPLRPDYHGGHPSWSLHRASEFDDLELDLETGDDDVELNLLVNSRGVRTDSDAEVGGDGLAVDRTYRDGDGDEIDADEITPGDVVYSKIELENTSNSRHRDLAVVDRLPAALEVENPDLGAAELPGWAQHGWEPDNVDVRDDRVEIFGDLSSGETVEFVVPTRATMAGEFYVPAAEAEGMYDPDTWARNEAGELVVQREPDS